MGTLIRVFCATLLLHAGLAAQPQISERARKLHREAFVFDGHVHVKIGRAHV
jgi:hypothetical protein